MEIYSIAFTEKGRQLQEKIEEVIKKDLNEKVSTHFKSAAEFTKKAFENAEAIIYIGAVGIAVRSIAPYIKTKTKDPAVIVVDELGKFVIPILSGHIGGANDLAKLIASSLNSVPVITTATDINDKLAIDSWAVKHNFYILNPEAIKYIASDILEDKPIALNTELSGAYITKQLSDLKTLYPNFICQNPENNDIKVDEELSEVKSLSAVKIASSNKLPKKMDDRRTLYLIPKTIFVGMGCRKDKDILEVETFLLEILENYNISLEEVNSISSIDLKKEEAAFKHLHNKYKLKLNFYDAESLEKAQQYTEYEFSNSQLVQNTTGVGNVCERAAVLAAYNTLVPDKSDKEYYEEIYKDKFLPIEFVHHKSSKNGITISIVKYID